MSRSPDRWFYLQLFVVAYAGWLTIYRSVGTIASSFETYDFTTPLDTMLPVWPQWVWIYDSAS